MNVLLIGSGGREHAMAWKITQSPLLTKLWVAPGSDGIAQLPRTECVNIPATDVDALCTFASEHNIDLTVVGPEQPLALGIVDVFEVKGLAIFGPNQKAAQLEASKIFAKEVMKQAGIQTAQSWVFHQASSCYDHLANAQYPLVIKADGLAAGKGVAVCADLATARTFAKTIFEEARFGQNASVLIEACLVGRECSVLAITDGQTIQILESAQDHKRLLDHDQGPNTGGMGAYSPSPIFTSEHKQKAQTEIFEPLLQTLHEQGIEFSGILYAGLMMTEQGMHVLEFNVRFGDPETQVLLPRLQSDLLDIMLKTTQKKLSDVELTWSDQSAMTIVMASKGYPESSQKGVPIAGLQTQEDTMVFHAGTQKEASTWMTNGGRVLAVTAMAPTLKQAREIGYRRIASINFDGAQYRQDIGKDL
jgi:phosphoribosylamine--glycine ligase